MKRFIAAVTALLAAPAAFANTHCDAPSGVNIATNVINPVIGVIPAGNYPIITTPTGSQAILIPRSIAAGLPPLTISLTQLGIFGVPFSIATTSPLQLTCGSPDSANFRAIADALDMNFDFDTDGDSNTIGGAVTAWKVANEDGQRFDLKYGRGFRLSEASRIRLMVDLPIKYLRVNSATGGIGGAHGNLSALSAGLGVGLQVPVSANWWLTPRVSYTATSASRTLGGDNELLTASLSSNLRVQGVGRGELTLGNLIGYTQNVRTGLTGQTAATFVKQKNWWFRNGIAYQLPLGGRMFGRQSTLRTSYVFTLGAKDTMAYEQVHEAAISIGLRTRENDARSMNDVIRIGLLYTHAKNEYVANAGYDSLTLTAGFRF